VLYTIELVTPWTLRVFPWFREPQFGDLSCFLLLKLQMWHERIFIIIHVRRQTAGATRARGTPVTMLWDSFPRKLDTEMSNDKQINPPVLLLHVKTRIYASFMSLPYVCFHGISKHSPTDRQTSGIAKVSGSLARSLHGCRC
jgi:hypothetical protein